MATTVPARPLPAGRMEPQAALHFGVGLGIFSVALLGVTTNWVAAGILAGSIMKDLKHINIHFGTVFALLQEANKARHHRYD